MFDAIVINYITYSYLVEFSIAYFLLDKLYLKNKINYILFLLILLLGITIGQSYATIDTLMLFIFFLFLSLKNSEKKNAYISLLIVDFAYLIELISGKLSLPLLFMILEVKGHQQIGLFILFFIVTLIIIITLVILVQRWLYPYILNTKKEMIVSYLLTTCLFSYQTFSIINDYIETDYLKFLIILFYLLLIVLVTSFIQTFSKNKDLKFEAQKKKLEYEMMSIYSEEIKKQYHEMRKFRHDYINILSSIEYYLEQDKMVELKKFYHDNVKQTKSLFKNNILRLDDLQKIKANAVKSILTTKLILAQEKKIDVQIEVSEEIPDSLSIDPIVLIRILGILLDNAIEELETIKKGQLLVGIFIMNGDTVFIIKNTVRTNVEALHILKREGFSTKDKNRGLGLSNVSDLIVHEANLLLETTILNDEFIQKITILKG